MLIVLPPSHRSGVPRTAAEDQEGAAQPVFRAELQLQPGAALQTPVWREVPVQHQVGSPPPTLKTSFTNYLNAFVHDTFFRFVKKTQKITFGSTFLTLTEE